MSAPLVRCPGCDTGYDVSRRQPGARVRCPRCQAVLTVPPRDPPAREREAVTESAVLRRARGAPCARHPRAISRRRCSRCATAACLECLAPRPVDHLCAACAAQQELGGALPLDFGLLATPRLALRAFLPSFPGVLLWFLLATLAGVTLFALPGALGAAALAEFGLGSWAGSLGLGAVVAAGLAYWISTDLLLFPAGIALLVDCALRGRPLRLGEGLLATWGRVVRNAGALFGVFLVYFLLALLAVLPALPVAAWLLTRTGSWATAALAPAAALGLGVLFVLPALGLAVPVVILEERPALPALQRAWRLAQGRYPTLLALTFAFAALYAALSGGLFALGSVPLQLALPRLLDLFVPALLVTAYHGLAAEDAGVLGRGTDRLPP